MDYFDRANSLRINIDPGPASLLARTEFVIYYCRAGTSLDSVSEAGAVEIVGFLTGSLSEHHAS
jgi:hypothetical protein